MLKRDTHSRTV